MINTTGVLLETAWAGAAFNLLLYMLASHVSTSSSSFYVYIYLNFCSFQFQLSVQVCQYLSCVVKTWFEDLIGEVLHY